MKLNATFAIALGTLLIAPLSFTAAENSGKAAFDVIKAANEIDALVEAGLKKHDLRPNAEINDDTFVRRVYLNIAGRIPTIEEAETFHTSTSDGKRAQLIADLLDSDGAVSHGHNFWADVLRINTKLGTRAAAGEAAYRLWLKQALDENMPYDQFVRELVGARGAIWENGAVGYYLRDRGMPLDNMSNTIRVFLGTRLECAQCHNHPFDKWTQMDYFKMAAFSYGMDARDRIDNFPNRMALRLHRQEQHYEAQKKAVPIEGFPHVLNQGWLDRYVNQENYHLYLERLELTDQKFRTLADKALVAGEAWLRDTNAVVQAEGAIYPEQLRYAFSAEKKRALTLPHDYQYDDAQPNEPVSASTMFGSEIDLENIDYSTIEAYAEWITARDNPRFTKIIANRLWKRVFGHGIFEPVDDFIADYTFVSNPELLAYLEAMMCTLDYDMCKYMEVLYNTQSYQRAANPEEVQPGAPYYFAGPTLRRMSAEQIWDSIVALTLSEADSYQPLLKYQLASIEKVRRVNEAISTNCSEEKYFAMIEEIAAVFEELKPLQEELRVKMNAAQGGPDRELYEKLHKEYYAVRNKSDQVVAEIAYPNLDETVKEEGFLLASGMPEMTMQQDGGMRTLLSKPPNSDMPDPSANLDTKQKNDWLDRRNKEYKAYTELISEMARASELESPAPRGHFLREFGQSDREVIENAADHASVPQALHLLNGPIVEALTNPFSVFGSRVHQAGNAEEKIDLIFHAMLTREPTGIERQLALSEIEQHGDSGYESIVWALLNTQQFMFIQ